MYNTVIEVHRDVVETVIWIQLHGCVRIVIQILALFCFPNNERVLCIIESVVFRYICPIKDFCFFLSHPHDALRHNRRHLLSVSNSSTVEIKLIQDTTCFAHISLLLH